MSLITDIGQKRIKYNLNFAISETGSIIVNATYFQDE